MSIRILLIDDHQIMRQGLRSLLEQEEGIEVIAEADNGRNGVALLKNIDPDIVITDISMPELNGVETTHQILKKNPNIKVIALSMHSDEHFVRNILEAGASGYLLKDCAAEELHEAIRQVERGNIYLGPSITGIVVNNYVRRKQNPGLQNKEELTAKEREVLQLIAEGKSTSDISETLFVSVKTIETHRSHIMKKLKLHSIAELTKYALKEGLTTL